MSSRDMAMIDSVVTEAKATISRWKPDFGELITVEMPDGLSPERYADLRDKLAQWWMNCSACFSGAKMLILLPGVKLGIHSDEALKQLGYVKVDAIAEELLVK